MPDAAYFDPYALTPLEWAEMDAAQLDRSLGWVLGDLTRLMLQLRNLRIRLLAEVDDEVMSDLKYELQLLRQEESSLHHLESGLQSRLRAAAV